MGKTTLLKRNLYFCVNKSLWNIFATIGGGQWKIPHPNAPIIKVSTEFTIALSNSNFIRISISSICSGVGGILFKSSTAAIVIMSNVILSCSDNSL